MLLQLFLGSVAVSLSVIVEAGFIGAAIRVMIHLGTKRSNIQNTPNTMLALVGATIWLLIALTVCVWIWAALFIMVGAFDALEPSLYFAAVSFTTLGFGDILLPQEWRLLGGICAANGLLLFGLSTAFLVELFRRLDPVQIKK